ncbi:MAG: SEC-C metal-binding domain-containing protein, partial [Pseudomonadota bacterium]
VLDTHWREHLIQLEHLRSVIGFRGYAQRDPLNEYKTEAFTLFEGLLAQLRRGVSGYLGAFTPMTEEELAEHQARIEAMQEEMRRRADIQRRLAEERGGPGATAVDVLEPEVRVARDQRDPLRPETWGKVGRNELCPCGSGKKYKHCHGRV